MSPRASLTAAPPARHEPSTRPYGHEPGQGFGRRLRVAFVIPGAEFARLIMVHDVRQVLGAADVVVVTPNLDGLETLEAEGIRVTAVPMHRKITPLADVVSIVRLWRLFRRERPDIVHSYIPKGGLLGQAAGALAGVKIRLHACRGLVYTPDMPAHVRWMVRAGEWLTNHLAHRVLFVSAADRDYSVGEGLCPADRAIHTGSGIDLRHFDAGAFPDDTRERVRRELGIPHDAPLVLTIGRYVRDKGFREIAEAAAALRRDRPDVRFLWLAPVLRGETDVLPDDVHESLGGTVIRVDQVRDPRPFYLTADALLHPSYREGVPRVVMEAAAMGLPVLASDIAGNREVIRDGVTGRLFRVADARALERAVREWLSDPRGAAARAAQARHDVRARFDQDALGERILGIYAELATAAGIAAGAPTPGPRLPHPTAHRA